MQILVKEWKCSVCPDWKKAQRHDAGFTRTLPVLWKYTEWHSRSNAFGNSLAKKWERDIYIYTHTPPFFFKFYTLYVSTIEIIFFSLASYSLVPRLLLVIQCLVWCLACSLPTVLKEWLATETRKTGVTTIISY